MKYSTGAPVFFGVAVAILCIAVSVVFFFGYKAYGGREVVSQEDVVRRGQIEEDLFATLQGDFIEFGGRLCVVVPEADGREWMSFRCGLGDPVQHFRVRTVATYTTRVVHFGSEEWVRCAARFLADNVMPKK